MSESSGSTKRHDETINVIVEGRGYDVHVEYHGVMSLTGYVIYRGTFLCTLPFASSKQELLETARKRIRELQ